MKHTGRNVAIVGGAVLVGWLVLRGGGGRKASGDGAPEVAPASSRCVVWIRAAGISVDGVVVDVAAAVARCRAAGAAEVRATGGANMGEILRVVRELRAAAVKLYMAPDLNDLTSRLLP